MAENVLSFPAKIEQADTPAAPPNEAREALDAVKALTATVEELDRGMKMMVGIIAEHDTRLRALELAVRKLERRNVPAIVNPRGERAN